MDTLVFIVAFWLMLVGVYGAYSLVNSGRNSSKRGRAAQATRVPVRPARPVMRPRPVNQPQTSGHLSEVDILRAEVQHLRTEVVALSTAAARYERPRMRR